MNQGRLGMGLFTILLAILVLITAQVALTHLQLRDLHSARLQQIERQAEQVERAILQRRQLEGIAGDVARLAEAGNLNAMLVRDQLQAQGVVLRTANR